MAWENRRDSLASILAAPTRRIDSQPRGRLRPTLSHDGRKWLKQKPVKANLAFKPARACADSTALKSGAHSCPMHPVF